MGHSHKCKRCSKKPQKCQHAHRNKGCCKDKQGLTTVVQLLNMGDFGGRLFSQPINNSGRFGFLESGQEAGTLTLCDINRPVGGLSTIKTYFDQERKRNKNTLFLLGAEAYTTTNRNLFRPTNSEKYYRPTFSAFKTLGLDARGLSWHDFADETLDRTREFIHDDLKGKFCQKTRVVAVGINDPDNELPGLKPYHIFDMCGVKVAYTIIPDPRTMTNGFLNDPMYPTSRLYWGNITVETDIVVLTELANDAMLAAKAEGAEVTILNVGRGFRSGGTGSTVLANSTEFDIMYFDNSAQTFAGFKKDKNEKFVLCLAPWTNGEEYSRFSVVYDNVLDKIDSFIGKDNTTLIQVETMGSPPRDFDIMKQVLVPAFSDTVYGDPKTQKIIDCYDSSSHKKLDKKVATLTDNLILGLWDTFALTPDSDNTEYLNLVADSIKSKYNTDISLVSRNTLPRSPNRWLVNCNSLTEPADAARFGGIATSHWAPRSTQFRRIEAPFDLLKGDIWDSVYNQNGTNFVSSTSSLTVDNLFLTLDKSTSFGPTPQTDPFDDKIIQGISGFTYIYDPNLGSERVREVFVISTGKNYVRQPDGSIPDGSDTISVALDNYTLMSGSFSTSTYPLINTTNWTNFEYGSLVNSTIKHLESLGTFDPNDPIYNNRYSTV